MLNIFLSGEFNFDQFGRDERPCRCRSQLRPHFRNSMQSRVAFRTELVVRFNYGAIIPWVNRLDDGAINAIAGPERLVLRTPVELYGEDFKTMGDFTVDAGQSVPFVLSHGLSFQNPPLGAHGSVLARMERQVSRRWTLDRRRETFTDHTKGSDLCPNGRDRGRRDDLTPRALGRGAELGLPLLLAAGCHVHALGVDASRLLRRSAGMARLAG